MNDVMQKLPNFEIHFNKSGMKTFIIISKKSEAKLYILGFKFNFKRLNLKFMVGYNRFAILNLGFE